MQKFYKIENGKAQVGQGTIIPDGFIEYVVGQEPLELVQALAQEDIEAVLNGKLQEARQYLKDTDFYYARFLETGEVVSESVVLKRIEAREFIRANQ